MRSAYPAIGLAAALSAALAPASATAQDDAVALARTNGTLAGNAVFCDVDTAVFEDFLTRASEAINAATEDKAVRDEASAELTTALVDATETGPAPQSCEVFLPDFEAAHQALGGAPSESAEPPAE